MFAFFHSPYPFMLHQVYISSAKKLILEVLAEAHCANELKEAMLIGSVPLLKDAIKRCGIVMFALFLFLGREFGLSHGICCCQHTFAPVFSVFFSFIRHLSFAFYCHRAEESKMVYLPELRDAKRALREALHLRNIVTSIQT